MWWVQATRRHHPLLIAGHHDESICPHQKHGTRTRVTPHRGPRVPGHQGQVGHGNRVVVWFRRGYIPLAADL